MGLIYPNEGFLEIDGKRLNQKGLKTWRDRIAHVPQDIFFYSRKQLHH